MKRFLTFTTLAVISLISLAEPQKTNPTQELKKAVVGDCIGRGLQRGDDPDYVYSFCNCTWEVISKNLTVAEFIEMDTVVSEKINPGELPQFQRIQPKLQACKNAVKKKP